MKNNILRLLSGLIVFTILGSGVAMAAVMNDYCITPPFIQTPILPNVLLLLDNSASQYDLTYTGATDCYDSSYNNSTTYEGYFPYSRDTLGNRVDYIYQYDMVNNKFIRVSSFPTATTATYDTAYLYVHINVSGTTRYVDSFYATGNFLNWLSMSKLDIQKKVLTGGKWISGTAPYLLAQSRGCNGMRYLKSVPEADWIHHLTTTITLASGATQTVTTFNMAVRGPQASENYDPANPNNMISPSTLGGQTKLEIYESSYNYSQCQNAITSWQQQISGNGVGSVWTNVQACLGTSGTGNTTAGRENSNYTEWVRDCIQVAQNIKAGLTTYDPSSPNSGILKNVTPNNFAGNCESVYVNECGVPSNTSSSNAAQMAVNQTTIQSCATLNNSLGGNYICSRKTNLLNGPVAFPYNAADSYAPNASVLNDGYSGSCWNGQTQGGSSDTHFSPSGDSSCLARQILHFCASTTAANVIDPSGGTADAPTSGNTPAILVEAGLRSGGNPLPYNSATGSTTMLVNVDMASQPTDGIIQRYSNGIRLGVMTFNFDGSKSECYDPITNTGPSTSQIICGRYCYNSTTPASSSQKACKADADCLSGETCTLIPQTDGSMILPNAYIGDPIGDHTSGIIQAIDNINATSWTPFAEAMYNAIGYYAADASTGNSRWRLQTGDFSLTRNPQQYKCQPNNLLLITDGMSTADQNSTVNNVASWAQAASGLNAGQTGYDSVNKCPTYSGSRNFDDLVWLAKNKNINTLDLSSSSALAASPAPGTGVTDRSQYITSYIIFTGADQPSMPGQCNPTNLLNAAATNSGTTLFQATQPSVFKTQLDKAFALMAAGLSSGTAASILSNSEGSGAALLQAIFYPRKDFDQQTSASWIGELQSFWYYLDPYLQKTSIREDTNGDFKLNLIDDKVVQFYFDASDSKTKVNKYTDANGDGSADSTVPDTGFAGVSPDTVNSLWMAGQKLWNRNLTTLPRTIYTGYNSVSGSTPAKFSNAASDNFNTDTSTLLWDVLQIPNSSVITGIANSDRKALATKLINYVAGTDQANDASPLCLLSGCTYRNRKVTLQTYCASNTTDYTACTHEWRLGDIISSTPKLVANLPLNTYHLSPPTGYNDSTYFNYVNTASYKNRGMAFVGSNDGMLHAFKLGVMQELKGPTIYDKAQMKTASGSTVASDLKAELGQEAWAFVPTNSLPYLKYLADPAYGHLYYVDKSPLIVDASIGKPATCTAGDYSECTKTQDTWRSVLIAGMGVGGASRDVSASHPLAVPPPVTITNADGTTTKYGYSSYFALDVTDPANPKYMWEFSNSLMGFATTGPAIVRIAAKKKKADGSYVTPSAPDHTENGKWFALFASGPDGSIDTTTHSFKGQSDQRLRLFVVDLATGSLVTTIDCFDKLGIGLDHAFAGSLSTSVIDVNRSAPSSTGFYSDDAIYIGYTKMDPATCTSASDISTCSWTKGGVLRVSTHESTNPNDWTVSSLIDDVGPVTTSPSKLQDRGNKNLWVYFGTGRYYYKNDDPSTTRQAIYGLKDQCYTTANTFDATCTTPAPDTVLQPIVNQSDSINTVPANASGWKILLDAKDTVNSFLTERSITDPLAAPNGAVFFTTFKPSNDLCKYGGNSLLWAVRYDTGATPPAAAMKGKGLMQVSTGAFQEISLADAFGNTGSTRYDGRRLATPITGVPPTAQGLSLFTNPKPAKKILHYQER